MPSIEVLSSQFGRDAFTKAPYAEIKLEAEYKSLYGNELPYYALDLRGTIAENAHFTAEEITKQTVYNNQFMKLITAIAAECQIIEIKDATLTNNLDTFYNRIEQRKYYVNQRGEFYSRIKESLEVILANLKHNTLLHTIDKKRIMCDLLREIINCGPGIYNHIETAREEISTHNTIEAWLAQLRKTLIKQLAHQHLQKYAIRATHITHIENVLLQYASDQKWYPYGYENLSSLNEIHASLANITAEDLQQFHHDFLQAYNPSAQIGEIANRLSANVSQRIAAEQHECKSHRLEMTQEKLYACMTGLPIINQPLGINTVFSVQEEEDKDTRSGEFYISHIGKVRLRSIDDLKIHLVRYFLIAEKQLYHIIQDENYVVVPGFYDLCYCVDENLPKHMWPQEKNHEQAPLLTMQHLRIKHSMSLEAGRRFKLPLHNERFQYYYQRGERDFREFKLENVNLSNVNIEELNLNHVRLNKVTLTPQQYIYLHFKQRDLVRFEIDDLVCEASDIGYYLDEMLSMSFEEKKILLFYAVKANQPGLLRILLQAGADPYVHTRENESPVHLAATRQYWDCIKVFVEEKPDSGFGYSKYGYDTVLLCAAKNRRWEMVEFLFEKHKHSSCLVTYKNYDVLHCAAESGKAKIIRLLLRAGADPAVPDNNNRLPIQIALDHVEWEDCVKAFAEEIVDEKGKYRFSHALLHAAMNHRWETVELLLQKKVKPSWHDRNTGWTELHFAVQDGRADIVRLLLRAGAAPGALYPNGRTPIELAADLHQWDCVKMFAKEKVDDTRQYRYGHALLLAAKNHRWDIVEFLIQKNVNTAWCERQTGLTTLHVAAQNGSADIVRLLLRVGASASAIDSDNLTPIQIAAVHNQWDCVKVFAEESIDADGTYRYSQALIHAAKNHRWKIVEFLLEHKVSPKQHEYLTELTALHFAAQAGNVETIRLLLNAGADPDAHDDDLHTPIQSVIIETIRDSIENGCSQERAAILLAIKRYYDESRLKGSYLFFTNHANSFQRMRDILNILNEVKSNKPDHVLVSYIRTYSNFAIQTGFFGRSYLRTCLNDALDMIDNARLQLSNAI
jgi:ankyrin repeat protein